MRRVLRSATVVALGVVLLVPPMGVAAQSTSPSPGASIAPAASSAPGASVAPGASGVPAVEGPFPDLQAIFEPTRPPIELVVTPAADATVSALMPITGGELEATGADGSVYHLSIPPDALLLETEISLTPLATVEGLPTGGEQTFAVQLGPDGLQLYADAILTITPAVELPVAEQVLFGYEGAKGEMFLAPPVVDEATIQLPISHFSGYGATKGLLADMSKERERLGGSIERRLWSQMAEAIGIERQRQNLGETANPDMRLDALFAAALAEFESRVLEPRIAAAGKSCANGRLAIETGLGYARQRSLMGAGEYEFPPGLVKTVTHVCMQEEYEICRDEHIIHRVATVAFGMERQRQLMRAPDAEESAFGEEMTKRCLTFELEFDSETSLKGGGTRISSTVEATVPLTIALPSIVIEGSGVLTNTDFTFKAKVPCPIKENRSDSVLDVYSLTWTTDNDAVTDYVLTWLGQETNESATLKCPPAPPTTIEMGQWSDLFAVAHEDEVEGQAATGPVVAMALAQGAPNMFDFPEVRPAENTGPFRFTGWQVSQAEILGMREWTKKSLGGKLTERGSFVLRHKPG